MAAIYNLFQASFFINFDRRHGATVDRLTPVDEEARFPNGGSFGSRVLATGVVSRRALTPTPSASVSLSLSPSPSEMVPSPLPPLLKTHDAGRSRSIELPSNREYLRRHPVKFPLARDYCGATSKFKFHIPHPAFPS